MRGAVEAAPALAVIGDAVERRAAARGRQEHLVGHRREERGEHRPAVLDQRDRDRPVRRGRR